MSLTGRCSFYVQWFGFSFVIRDFQEHALLGARSPPPIPRQGETAWYGKSKSSARQASCPQKEADSKNRHLGTRSYTRQRPGNSRTKLLPCNALSPLKVFHGPGQAPAAKTAHSAAQCRDSVSRVSHRQMSQEQTCFSNETAPCQESRTVTHGVKQTFWRFSFYPIWVLN